MITNHKDLFKDKYEWLFAKASDLLELEESNRINSLDKYFSKLGDIVNKMVSNKKFDESYFLLPFDEPMFEINADTREIKIPTVFQKGVAVQGDNASEVLVFVIDRYFDYKDLGSDNITIYIQYTAPDGKENMYQVGYKDLETHPGKVRFGWILSDIATKTAGTLKFSVKFVTTEEDGSVAYSFNTKPHSILIHAALQTGLSEVDGLTSEAAFYKFVRNSLEKGEVPAQTPLFTDDQATNLEKTINLLPSNEYTLIAQATKGDAGDIAYAWRYSEDPEFKDDGVLLESGESYTIKDYYKPVNAKAPSLREDYYVKLGDDDDGIFEKYIFTPGTPESDIPQLYERYTSCEILNTDNRVIGAYRVSAKNILTEGKNESAYSYSNICVIPPLKDFEVTENLSYDNGSVFEEGVELTTPNYTAKPLKVSFKADPGALYKYTLYHNGEPVEEDSVSYEDKKIIPENGEVVIEKTFNEMSLEEANAAVGLYCYEIEAKKNRDTKGTEYEAGNKILTDPCTRLTFYPTVPARETDPMDIYPSLDEDIYTITSDIILYAEENENGLPNFTSDEYIYDWRLREIEDHDYVSIREDASYVVKATEGEEHGQGYPVIQINRKELPYSCVLQCCIKNKLNGLISNNAIFSNCFVCVKPLNK